MLAFVTAGTIGDLSIGATRADVQLTHGLPASWVGKPPCFGPEVIDPLLADVWHYWDQAVAVGFDAKEVVCSLTVFPERIVSRRHTFEDWPAITTQASLESWLLKMEVPYFWLEHDGWIATGTGFYAHGVNGSVSMMTFARDLAAFPRWIVEPLKKYSPELLARLQERLNKSPETNALPGQ